MEENYSDIIRNIDPREFAKFSADDMRNMIKRLCEGRGKTKCWSKDDYKQCLSEIVDEVFYGK